MLMKGHNKLVLAVVQEEDYDATVEALGKAKIFVTKLSSTGGFLRKKNFTLMIGVEESQLKTVYQILEKCAGKREETHFAPTAPASEARYPGYTAPSPSIPIKTQVGGTVVFTLDMDSMQRF